MRAYKLEILVIDRDDLGADGVADVLHNANYPNDCISPLVMAVQSSDIGEWDDAHPLNQYGTMHDEFRRLFPPQLKDQG